MSMLINVHVFICKFKYYVFISSAIMKDILVEN